MTDFDVLLIALKQAGGTPHVDELLDLLYLSRQQLFSSKEENEVRGGIQHPLSPGGGTGGQGGVSTPAKNKDDFREVDPSSLDASVKPQIRPARVDLPKPVHFTSRLSLERALWPLRRRTPLQASAMLDELATSETAADLWLYNLLAWQPKFLKERTRWYDIVLLVDTAPSMKIWGQEVTEFSGLFAKQKFIRRFTPRFVNTNSDDDIEKLITSFNGKVLQRGRTLFLVVSDCIGKTWRNGKIPAFLETKMSIAQVVLVQPLPQALWYLSAVHDAGQGYVAPRERSEPNENMLAYPPEYRKFYDGFLPLPIVQLKETSVLRWAKAASGLRRQVLPAFYFASPEIEEDTSSWDITRRLGEFNKRASNDAVRLARLLPILIEKDEGSFDLQDARSFAQALEPSWGNDVLAEVLLGKLIEIKLDAFNPEQVMFEFYPGVDEMLSRSLTSTEVRDAWYALSQQKGNERKTGLQEYFGSLQDVRDLQDDEVILSHSLRDRIFRGVGLGQPDPLQGLRRLMQARPQVAKELAGWERNLRNLANKLQQVQIDSPEAAAALNVAQTAHGVDKLHQEIEEKRIALQQATADLRLDEITRVITRGVSISNQLNSSDEFAEFPAILRELMDNVNDLKAEAEQAKINISVELNVYLTLMQSEKYDLALDILYKSQEGGILQVPVSFGSDAVTDIMSAIHQVRQNLIDYLKKKIGERLTSAKNALATQSDFGLLNAEIELKQARKLCENQYVGADLEKEEIVTKELYELEEGVNQLLEQRAEALELLKVVRSLDEKDALQKLGALKYPWREEIESLKTEIQNKARDSKVRPPNEPLRTRLISILETTAHEVLDQGQTELAVRLIKARDLAKEMGEGSLSSDLRAKLEDLAGEDFLRASVPELYENLTPVMESVRLEAFPKKNTEEIPNILADSQLENALSDLRRLMQARPQAVDELAAWEQNLRNLATSIQPEQRNSPEIVAALNLTQAARDLGKLYKTIQKNRTELLDAATRKQLGEISKIITITTSILNQLQDGKEFAEFPPILHDLLTDAKDLSDEANTAKVDVGAKLNVFITLAQVGKYDSALDELYKMLKDGILQVPVAFGDHDLIDIFSVITRTLNEFVNYSKQKIAERLTNAENALARRVDSGLLDAETELNQAKELCQNRYVSEYLSHEEIIIKNLSDLDGKIIKLLESRNNALALLEIARDLDEVDAIRRLDALQYKWLEEVAILREEIQWKLLTKTENKIDEQFTAFILLLCKERKAGEDDNYRDALKLLENERSEIEPLSDVVDITSLLEKVDQQVALVKTERDQWLRFGEFQKKFHELSTSKQVDTGTLKRLALEDQRAYWREYFKAEYEEIETEAIKQAGGIEIFNKAWEQYLQDPTNNQIKAMLEDQKGQRTVPFLLSRQADMLLDMHQAYATWQEARIGQQNTSELIDKSQEWYEHIQVKVRVSNSLCQKVIEQGGENLSTEESKMQADAADLKAELAALQKQVANLYDLWDRCSAFLSEEKYKEAYLKLKESKWDEDPTPEIRNIHAVLSSYIKDTWRNAYVGTIQAVIIASPPSLGQLRRTAGDIGSLEEFNVLNHDGDGLLVSTLYSTWHLYEVEDALGMKLDQIQEDQLDSLGARLDWGRILEHLDGLMKYPPNGKTLSQVSLLRPVALVHYGLALERNAGITWLREEIKRMPPQNEAAAVYVTLALRYLEEPSGIQQAKNLALELEDLGWRTSQSAAGLKKIVTAHQLWRSEELIQAINSLNDGLDALKQSMPGLGTAYESVVRHTAQNWYQVMGESVLDGLQKETRALAYGNTFPHSKFFDVWRRLDSAARYLPGDRRIENIRQLLNRFSVGIGKTLLEDVNGLLGNTEDTLKHKIEKGGRVLGYLEIAFGERTSTAYKPISEDWSELEGLVDVLKERHSQREKAWEVLNGARRALQSLLMISPSNVFWAWSRDSRNQPMQGISEIENKLSVVSEEMRGYIPTEFNRFNQFLAQFRQAITVITPGFQEFVQAVREEKYENALRLLKERLRGDRDNFENRLNELRKDAFDESLAAIRLDPFYRLEDPIQAVEVVGLDALEKHMTLLLKNCSTWLEFSKDSTAQIRELVGRRNEARRYLTIGRLGDAVNLCREEIPDMFDEKVIRNDIPRLLLGLKRKVVEELPKMEAPLSMRALREAKPDEDFPTPTDGTVSAAFGELMEASRKNIRERWAGYLGFEICVGLMDLGPSTEGMDYPEGLSSVWEAVWFEGLRKTMGMLEKPRQVSLEELIERRVKELEEAVREINRHLNRFTGNNVTERSQLALRSLIEQADRIDARASLVVLAHQKYEQRQRYLAAKRK